MILFLVLSRTQYHSSLILFALLDNLSATRKAGINCKILRMPRKPLDSRVLGTLPVFPAITGFTIMLDDDYPVM